MIYIYDDDDVSHPMLWSIAMVHTKRILNRQRQDSPWLTLWH